MKNKILKHIKIYLAINFVVGLFWILFNFFNEKDRKELYQELSKNGFVTTATYIHNNVKGFPGTPAAVMIYYSFDGRKFTSVFKCSYEHFQKEYKNRIDSIIVSKSNALKYEYLNNYSNKKSKNTYFWLIVSVFTSSLLYIFFIINTKTVF